MEKFFYQDERQPNENEYIGEDGLIFCSVCKKPKQALSVLNNGTTFKHRHLCDCDKKRIEKEEEECKKEEKLRLTKKLTRICFDDTNTVKNGRK